MKLFSTKENLLFMAGHFATDLCHGSLPIILAYMYQEGRLTSYSAVALLMMTNTILNAVIQPLAGNLADSKPRPYLMSIGIIDMILETVIFLLSSFPHSFISD